MVPSASSRASWLLSLAVLGLACNGTREDPSPGDAPPPHGAVSSGSGGGATGGGAAVGGGDVGGGSSDGFVFDDCSCAGIAESLSVAACNTCTDAANMPDTTCGDQRATCVADDAGCGLALTLLSGNDCAGDPDCVADLIKGLLDDDSAALLFGYYGCLCGQCATCTNDVVAGGGAPVGGGASTGEGSCIVSPG